MQTRAFVDNDFFTFQSGSIQIDMRTDELHNAIVFTFQSGSIQIEFESLFISYWL